MKTKLLTRIAVTLTGLTAALTAETEFERDLKQLQEQRDRAIAAASEPIQRRYKESLEQLLRRATQGNDLDTALKIKTVLGQTATAPAVAATPPANAAGTQPAPPAPPPVAALTDLKLQLAGTRWKQVSYGSELSFREGTTVQIAGDMGTYKVKGREKLTLTFGQREEELALSKDGRHLERTRNIPVYDLLPPK